MMNYQGVECPICGKPFQEDDDIVVCPECGAPHHRECYTAHGQCGYAEQHGTPEAWDKQQQKKQEESTTVCPHCHQTIPSNSLFCPRCGQSLGGEQQQTQQQTPPASPFGFGGGPFGGGQNTAYQQFDPLAGVDPKEEFDGVPAETLVKVVRVNTRKYMHAFLRIKRENRSRFNIGGLLLGCGWLLYRKQYWLGIITAIITGLLFAGQIITNRMITTPMTTELYQTLNIAVETPITQVLANQLMDELWKKGFGTLLLYMLPLIFSGLQIVMNVIIAFFGTRWYYHHCVKTAKAIDSTVQMPADKETAYQKRGGTQVVALMIYFLCYMAISYIPILLP